MKQPIYFFILILLFTSCQDKNEFTYQEFKEALYYSPSTGKFSKLANLEMCINRWGNPEYVKSLGTMNLDGSNQRTHTIIFTWPKLIVDGRTVEISFQMDSSEFTIEELNRGQNPWPHVAKHAIVKEFRMSGLPK